MGTLAFTTLEDRASTDSTAVLNAVHGSAKVWLHYLQTTPAIQDSYNVDSVSDDSAGAYTVTIGTDFAAATYAIVSSKIGVTVGGASTSEDEVTSIAVGTYGMRTIENGVAVDTNSFTACFGDQ